MLKRFENLGTALSRNESKIVYGGNTIASVQELIEAGPDDGVSDNFSSCSANCVKDGVAYTVSCSGSWCKAYDNSGCYSFGNSKSC